MPRMSSRLPGSSISVHMCCPMQSLVLLFNKHKFYSFVFLHGLAYGFQKLIMFFDVFSGIDDLMRHHAVALHFDTNFVLSERRPPTMSYIFLAMSSSTPYFSTISSLIAWSSPTSIDSDSESTLQTKCSCLCCSALIYTNAIVPYACAWPTYMSRKTLFVSGK